jgi:hypothetical protein
MGYGMEAGARIEIATESNLGGIKIKGGDFPANDRNLRLRHNYVWFSGNWGKLSLGQTSDSIDGTGFADQSGAWLAAENYPDHGSQVNFRDDTTGATTGLIVSHIFYSFDGGRRDLVKYDSPAFGPLTISVDADTNNRWNVGGWLDMDLAGGHLTAALGYGEFQATVAPSAIEKNELLVGSISYKFSQGTNLMFAYGAQDFGLDIAGFERDDADHWYVALGHDWGNNSARVQYQETDDRIQGCGGESIGVGFNHAIPKPKVDLFAAYHNYSADCDATGAAIIGSTNGDLQDVDVFVVGGKVAFD